MCVCVSFCRPERVFVELISVLFGTWGLSRTFPPLSVGSELPPLKQHLFLLDYLLSTCQIQLFISALVLQITCDTVDDCFAVCEYCGNIVL